MDYATQGYIALVGTIVLVLRGGYLHAWPVVVVAHAVWLGLIHWLIQAQAKGQGGRLLHFLRNFYPILLYTALYRETGYLNQMVNQGYWDPTFIRLEERVCRWAIDLWHYWNPTFNPVKEKIFGGQPSLAFMARFPYRWVGEIFYASYFSYYIMIGGVGLALFIRGRKQFHHYVSVVSFVFYVCYLIYIFVPVIGPRMFYKDIVDFDLPLEVQPSILRSFPEAVQAGLFYRIMAVIYENFESPGAAFPSSHVIVAFCTLYFSFRYLKRLRWVHLVVFILLCAATVYCRYHYVVDVIAGLIGGVILVPVANVCYRRWGEIGAEHPNGPLPDK